MLSAFVQWLLTLANQVPLEIFVFVGTFIEEVIAPIPTPIILGTAGYLARESIFPLGYILLLALVGATAKVLASYLFYILGQKSGEVFIARWGKFFGVSLDDHTALSRKLNRGVWDDVFLVGIRVLPIIPTFVVSLACGAMRIKIRTFLWTTFVGNLIRNIIILCAGAYATSYMQSFWNDSGKDMFENPLYSLVGLIGLIIGALLALLIRKKIAKKARS